MPVFLANAFVLFGSSHVAALFAMLAIATALVIAVRRIANSRVSSWVGHSLAVVLLANKLIALGIGFHDGKFNLQNALPLHLCDLAAICAMIALCTRKQLAYELAYFWGLGGTLQALITPDLPPDFPNIRYFTFFIGHCGILVGVAYLTFALEMRPVPRSLLRVFWACQVYLLTAAVVDFSTGANYGYVRGKPLHASLMDDLGPWPYYLISLEALALFSFAFYYLPFFILDRTRRSSSTTRAGNVL
jgi:hypothetical integral membrane protein (TIGR02206 family)